MTKKNHGDFKHLGYDSNGVKEDFHFDEEKQEVTIARTFLGDASPLAQIELNKAFQNSGHSGYSSDKTYKQVASIPVAVIESWVMEFGVDPTAKGNEVLLARLLNSPDYRFLRTGGGRIGFKES